MHRPLLLSALLLAACNSGRKDDIGSPDDSGADADTDADTDVDTDTDADTDADTDVDSDADTDTDPDGDGDGVPASEDCDDADASVFPGADEVCDGVDQDCDGDIDEDATDALTWYPDGDGDGWGVSDGAVEDCDAPQGFAQADGDCDDTDASVNPGADETWYDGVDGDCDGASDYDADADGSDAEAHGGGDCDDTDPAVYEGEGCRPVATCTHPDAATLLANAPGGAADIAFDDTCRAWITTIVSGGDRVVYFDSSGTGGSMPGPSDWDMSAVAFDPATGAAVVGYSSTQAVGWETTGGLSTIATSGGGYVTYGGGAYANGYLNDSPPSLVMDSAGCIWTPNWASRGTLACVETDGTVTTWELSTDTAIMAVDLDAAETLFVAIGDTLSEVDPATGGLTTVWTGAGAILDFVIDFDDSFYVETADDLLTHVSADGSTSTTFDTVSGDARLALTPDGSLVRMMANPTGAATFDEYALD